MTLCTNAVTVGAYMSKRFSQLHLSTELDHNSVGPNHQKAIVPEHSNVVVWRVFWYWLTHPNLGSQ
eukprot:3653402-Rhodomonas_salina.1